MKASEIFGEIAIYKEGKKVVGGMDFPDVLPIRIEKGLERYTRNGEKVEIDGIKWGLQLFFEEECIGCIVGNRSEDAEVVIRELPYAPKMTGKVVEL